MNVKIGLTLAIVILMASGCAPAASRYCREIQGESPIAFSEGACERCYDRYGPVDREIIMGCAAGIDTAEYR